jgi:hypothetical protein
MSPAVARKAAQCIVVPFKCGTRFRVGGRTEVYDVYPDMISGELRCSCRSRAYCSHLLAVEHHRKTAVKQQQLRRTGESA